MAEPVWVLTAHGDQDPRDDIVGVLIGSSDAVTDYLRAEGRRLAELLDTMHGGKARMTLLGASNGDLRVYIYSKGQSVTVVAKPFAVEVLP